VRKKLLLLAAASGVVLLFPRKKKKKRKKVKPVHAEKIPDNEKAEQTECKLKEQRDEKKEFMTFCLLSVEQTLRGFKVIDIGYRSYPYRHTWEFYVQYELFGSPYIQEVVKDVPELTSTTLVMMEKAWKECADLILAKHQHELEGK